MTSEDRPPGERRYDEAASMTLVEHLDELRSRIIVVALAVGVAAVAGFFIAEPVLALLQAALPDDTELIQLRVLEGLGVRIRLALLIGLSLAMPVILYELWAFVTPGLTKPERRLVWPLLVMALVFFAAGIVLGYLIIPNALSFLLGLALPGVPPMLDIGEYVGFVTTLMIAFGLAFQFPVIMLLLNRAGILTYGFLAGRRRYIIVLIVLVAIMITPGGDPISSGTLSLVMYGLFEGTLQLMRLRRSR
ncbi:MAG: twin-arginine translocase subunit TatC [Chloroflexi bacterium]|nr:twin-arginine translocase subunit TatC [Chloroflexota bacterium]